MSNEVANRFAGGTDGGGHSGRSRREPAPLQSRAKFLQNWDWSSVAQINGGLCERSRAQRGVNSETHAAVAEEWEKHRVAELSLLETFQFLQSCHRRAPFLFFNGNTFAEIGRALATALFHELPFHRRKEVSSAVAHFVTGVLDLESMTGMVESLCESAEFKTGDRVKTLRGSLNGVIVKILDDGKIVWQPHGTKSELTALPESLLRED
ncbi:MAG TPA: hypothetical protein VGM58_07155 [Verrucomicrobiae bacterium]|jgi:hypothetical protein